MTQDFIKALLINAAYQGATAVCESVQGGNTIPIDPLIQDAGLQNKGVMVYEEAKVQYAALCRAFEDKTGVWPDPKVSPDPSTVSPPKTSAAPLDPVAIAGLLANVLTKAVPGNKTVSTIADVVSALSTVAGTAATIKAPGQELPTTPAPAAPPASGVNATH
jgi:hypothetical protein